MALLTPGCTTCQYLSQRVAELEGRVSVLRQIKEDEELLDSMVAQTTSKIDDVTCPWLGTSTFGEPVKEKLHSVPLNEPWPRLGAKPKGLVCSTPSAPPQDAWIAVRGVKHSRKRNPSNVSEMLLLGRRFEVLEDLEVHSNHTVQGPSATSLLLPSHSQVEVPKHTHLRSLPAARSSDSAASPPQPARRQITRERPCHLPSKPICSPSVLVVGSSMVRNVSIRKAETFCYPGARIPDLNSMLPLLISKHSAASTVIVHVGSNDIKLQQSEKLRDDFKTLINTLLESGKQCVVSGPFPSPRYTDMVFSRIRQLHTWLKGYCCTMGIPFVDNFAAFTDRPGLFLRDNLHLNRYGSSILSTNMSLTLASCRASDT